MLIRTILIFCIALMAVGQSVAQDRVRRFPSTTITLDSSETVAVYYGFFGRAAGARGFSATSINPKDEVMNDGGLVMYGTIDSVAVNTESDSLTCYALPLGHDGYVLGTDTLWCDFTNEITGDSEAILDWTPWNRSAKTVGTDTYTFTIDITNDYPIAFGFKIVFRQYADDSAGVQAQNTVTLNVGEKE